MFDTVVLAEVLEHVPDPKPFEEAVRVCKSGGRIIISVPRGYNIPDPDHVRIFTQNSMESLINSVVSCKINWIKDVPSQWLMCSIEIDKGKVSNNLVSEIKEPIDILPNRRKKTIVRCLQKYGSKVEVVIMDMSRTFKTTENQQYQKILYDIKIDTSINNLFNLLFNKKHNKHKLNELEEELFVSILKQVNVLGWEKTLNHLNSKIKYLSKDAKKSKIR